LCPVFLLFFFPAFFPASKQKFKVRLQSYGTWVRKKLIVSLAQEMNWCRNTGEWMEEIYLKWVVPFLRSMGLCSCLRKLFLFHLVALMESSLVCWMLFHTLNYR
jgi:hypothetical protein